MLQRLRTLLTTVTGPVAGEDPEAHVRLCVAALLVEIARADHQDHDAEYEAIASLIGRYFLLDQQASAELMTEAREAVDGATSLREFTAPLHEKLSVADKQQIIGMLWEVALQDRNLDRYEDYLIGKVAELLYVPRGDVVRLRFQATARETLNQSPNPGLDEDS